MVAFKTEIVGKSNPPGSHAGDKEKKKDLHFNSKGSLWAKQGEIRDPPTLEYSHRTEVRQWGQIEVTSKFRLGIKPGNELSQSWGVERTQRKA